jgi:AcrR family transcriptional regulator
MSSQPSSARIFKGRESQKNRTRKALVAAAEALIRQGHIPTVSEAAEASGISRATSYRYFPTQDLLLAEVALFAASGPLFPAAAEDGSVADVVGRLVRQVAVWAYDNEQPLRTLLRLSLDPSTGVQRPGHRRQWIAEALAPAKSRMDPETYNRLSKALTLMLGIDPVVVMKDIAGASREQALDALEWSARTLAEAALKDTRVVPKSPSTRKLSSK